MPENTTQTTVGVDIGGTKTAVSISTHHPDVQWRRSFPTEPARGPEHALRTMGELIEEGLRTTQTRVSSIGVSCGGPLDPTAGLIQSPPNLPTWDNVPIVRILSERFGAACRIENDANAGAVAESRYGAGVGARSVVFLTMGTGLGAGIVIDGHLLRGATECAGEIGHVRLTRGGPVGYGKAGSAEGWASGAGVAQLAAEAVRKHGSSTLLSAVYARQGFLTALDVATAEAQGDAAARRIITTTGRRLGQALAILIDIVNPERIVIGGLAMRLGEKILAPARAVVQREALAPAVRGCSIVPAALGERIGDIAALCVAEGL